MHWCSDYAPTQIRRARLQSESGFLLSEFLPLYLPNLISIRHDHLIS